MALPKKAISIRVKLIVLAMILFLFFLYYPYVLVEIRSPIQIEQRAKVDSQSFWFKPWGESGVHKGIDVFAARGTEIRPAVGGLVIDFGYGTVGGHYLYILGYDLRTHYYAHLDTLLIYDYGMIDRNTVIGRVGSSGNAIFRPPHLHYSIYSIAPNLLSLFSSDTLKLTRMFYVDPYKLLYNSVSRTE
jgi:peptidoglycan LD-endopeptidase LytH